MHAAPRGIMDPVASTAVAILAAGRGSRFGGDTAKPLLELQGRPLIGWAMDAAMESGLRPALLVVGHQASRVDRLAPQGVTVVRGGGGEAGSRTACAP